MGQARNKKDATPILISSNGLLANLFGSSYRL